MFFALFWKFGFLMLNLLKEFWTSSATSYSYLFPLTECSLKQRSRTFLAPGTGFVEDSFSTDCGDGGRGGEGDGAGGNVSNGERL